MKTHQMNLQKRYFDYIRNGTKRIELRLNDEKRQKIQIGDIIEFSTDDFDWCNKQVVALYRAKSFEELFKDFDISILADKSMTKEELLSELGKFYTKEKQEKYGVVGIRIDDAKCPKCGEKLAPWVFGMPTGITFEKADRKEVILGGCEVFGNEPTWHCFKCNHDFDEEFKDLGETEIEEDFDK